MSESDDKPAPSGPPAATLLIATSDSATRALLRKALHVRAVEVVEASDGVEALALARRLELDLVILDAFLAVLDGISVCARIRAIPEINQPAIAIMGLSSERTVELAFAEGADEILTKPLHPTLIRQRVELLLRRRRLEKQLQLMERAVAAAGSGVTILDARSSEYPLSYANPAFEAMTGYTAADLEGKNLRLLRGPDTDVAALTELRDAMAAGRATRVLLKNYRKDGSVFWNDLSASPLLDPAGRVTHYVAVQTDVTDRMARGTLEAKHLEAFAAERTRELDASLRSVEDRRRFTETILNALSAGLITADATGKVSFANRAALHTLGMSLADCMGRSVVEIFGGNDEVRALLLAPPDPQREARLDFPVISPGGLRLYVGMSVMRVPEELRAELAFVFLFRNLAETLEREDLNALGPEAVPTAGIEPLAPVPAEAATDPESSSLKRRPVLALRYCAVPDLIDRATALLSAQFPEGGRPHGPEGSPGLPEVLVDRDQVADALARLLGNAAHRAGGLSRIRVKLEETEAVSERGVRSGAFVRVDILFPREEMTEEDMGTDEEMAGRNDHRRSDLVAAEQLLQANGGRVVHSPPGPSERYLSALIPAARRLSVGPEAESGLFLRSD
jgi:PAS domain S-box-containing protein